MMLKGLQMEPKWEVNRKKNIKGETICLVFCLGVSTRALLQSLELLLYPNQTFHTDYIKTVVRNQTFDIDDAEGITNGAEMGSKQKEKHIKGETKTT